MVQGNLKQTARKHPWSSSQLKHDNVILHDNAQPHTSLHTCEAITKMGWNVFPHSVHSPDLVPFNLHLFSPVEDALRGCHFADDNELKPSFCDVF
jgi:hypothetical protein